VRPGAIPWQPGQLLTGYADREAYRLGLLEDHGSFEVTRQRAYVNDLAHRYVAAPRFSAWIREAPEGTRVVRQPKEPARR
jgi:hypothetical protein